MQVTYLAPAISYDSNVSVVYLLLFFLLLVYFVWWCHYFSYIYYGDGAADEN